MPGEGRFQHLKRTVIGMHSYHISDEMGILDRGDMGHVSRGGYCYWTIECMMMS